jgi:hypothetical protein
MVLERAGLRADAALAGLACAFPMDGSGFLGHAFLLCVGWTSRHHSTGTNAQDVVPWRASPSAHVLQQNNGHRGPRHPTYSGPNAGSEVQANTTAVAKNTTCLPALHAQQCSLELRARNSKNEIFVYCDIAVSGLYLSIQPADICPFRRRQEKIPDPGGEQIHRNGLRRPLVAIPFFNDQTVKFSLLAFVLVSSALLEPINHRKLLASGLPASFLRKMRLLGFIAMPAAIFFLLEYWH